MVTFAMSRESKNVSFFLRLYHHFFLVDYIVTHCNLNLYAPKSTYKFSKLVSILFLIELIEGICSKFKRRPEIGHFTAT